MMDEDGWRPEQDTLIYTFYNCFLIQCEKKMNNILDNHFVQWVSNRISIYPNIWQQHLIRKSEIIFVTKKNKDSVVK